MGSRGETMDASLAHLHAAARSRQPAAAGAAPGLARETLTTKRTAEAADSDATAKVPRYTDEMPTAAPAEDSGEAEALLLSVKVDLHICLVNAAAEGDAPRIAWALARGADPCDPAKAADPDAHNIITRAKTLSPVARAALSLNAAGGEAAVRLLLDDGRCEAYAPEYCLTRFRPEVSAHMETQLDSTRATIVHYAAAKGRLALLALALDHPRAPPDAANLDGHYGEAMAARGGRCTPMHVAALANCAGAIDLLLSRGGDLAPRDCDGFDPLFLAARFGRDDAVAALLRNGASPNTTTKTDHTAIFMAIRYGHLRATFALLRAGASLGARRLPSGYRTPADYAVHKSAAENCDGRVAEQARAVAFARTVEATRGGVGAWCTGEVLELAKLRELLGPGLGRRGRADFFCTPFLAMTDFEDAPRGTNAATRLEVLNFCATSEHVAARTRPYSSLRELATVISMQHHVICSLFDARVLPVEVFALVLSFWLAPRTEGSFPVPGDPRPLTVPSVAAPDS